ncbi:MAG: hydrogenase maturation protease [Candidatus Cloacimonadales bacterium]|nr:hydrogenase maturation protease [Candidatus Cloacimonadales bacterium]
MTDINYNQLSKLIPTDKTILFVGIGNRLKSDDAIGINICENLVETDRKKVLIVESGIEKFVGKINFIAPDILLLIDCTDFNEKPGFIKLIPIEEVLDHTMHTHTISVRRISEFFEMPTYILGIQPEFVGFGEEISEEVLKAAKEVVGYVNQM